MLDSGLMQRGPSKQRHCFLLLRLMKIFLSWNVWEYVCTHTWVSAIALLSAYCTPLTLGFCFQHLPAALMRRETPRSLFLDWTDFTWHHEGSSLEWALVCRRQDPGQCRTYSEWFQFVAGLRSSQRNNHFRILKTVSSTEPVRNQGV